MKWWGWFGASIVLLLSALNATLIFDDVYAVELFKDVLARHGYGGAVKVLFFSLDLGPREYRLYGVSKLIHFGLWHLFGVQAWAYALVISATQIATGWAIYRLLTRAGADEALSAGAGVIWAVSPFAATSCFHHYSYLLLPVQVALLCALAIRWRTLTIVLGALIALTGEQNLGAAVLIIILGAVFVTSDRTWRQRTIDAVIPILAILLAAALHRWGWTQVVGSEPSLTRYRFDIPSMVELEYRSFRFLRSLPVGISEQTSAILAFSGLGGLMIVGMTAAFTARNISYRCERVNRDFSVTVALLLIGVASLSTVFLLSIITGQVSEVLPRRYGYVAYTLFAMALFAGFFTIGRWISQAPAMGVLGTTVGLWVALQVLCLPVIRAQDRLIWHYVGLAAQRVPNLLYPTNEIPHVESPGLRRGFPTVFESPLSHFWWQAQYSVVVLKAQFAAGQYEWLGDGKVRLVGRLSRDVPSSAVAIIEPTHDQSNWKNAPLVSIHVGLVPPPQEGSEPKQ